MTGSIDNDLLVALEAARAKKAEEMVALDVREVCDFTCTLVICHGASTRQVKTIAEAVIEALRERGRRPHHVEGIGRAEWVLIDYLDFVLHVFVAERRRFYALERLWGDAPRLGVDPLPEAPASRSKAEGSSS